MNAEENIIVFQSLTVLTWQSVLAEGDDNDRERKVRRMVLCIDWSGVISRPGTTGPHNRIVTENVKFRNIQPDWLYQSHHLISLFITSLPCITSTSTNKPPSSKIALNSTLIGFIGIQGRYFCWYWTLTEKHCWEIRETEILNLKTSLLLEMFSHLKPHLPSEWWCLASAQSLVGSCKVSTVNKMTYLSVLI